MRRDVFQAIADPNRRKIIQMIASQPMTLNEVAGHFKVSRPAISRHIKILAECGLLIIRQEGRERTCAPNYKSLQQVAAWAEQYRLFWTSKLDALDQFLQQRAPAPKKKPVTRKIKRK